MKIVFLNIKRINYDNRIDLSKYDDLDITYYDNTNENEILDRVGDAEIVVTKELNVNRDIIEKFSNVKLICEAGTGYNNIDIDACSDNNILVCNVPNYATDTVALFTIMLMLNMSVSMKQQIVMIEKNNYSNFGNNLMVNYSELKGKTLGIIGCGKIGRKVAKFATLLGMNVLIYSRTFRYDDLEYVSLEELLSSSDYISLHCSLNDDTYHILNKDNMKLIKRNACIINTARGALIDEKVLINMLENKKIAGCGLDVLENEPADSNNPLLKFDNCIITPHMAWNSIEARNRLMDLTINNINNYIDNNPINIVNE